MSCWNSIPNILIWQSSHANPGLISKYVQIIVDINEGCLLYSGTNEQKQILIIEDRFIVFEIHSIKAYMLLLAFAPVAAPIKVSSKYEFSLFFTCANKRSHSVLSQNDCYMLYYCCMVYCSWIDPCFEYSKMHLFQSDVLACIAVVISW